MKNFKVKCLTKGETNNASGELQHMKKFLKMLTSGSLKLDELLSQGQKTGDDSGVGHTEGKNKNSDVNSKGNEKEHKNSEIVIEI